LTIKVDEREKGESDMERVNKTNKGTNKQTNIGGEEFFQTNTDEQE